MIITEHQGQLLEELCDVLLKFERECVRNDDFNIYVAELNIFSRSIDEIIIDLP
jgi:hypothetical protein